MMRESCTLSPLQWKEESIVWIGNSLCLKECEEESLEKSSQGQCTVEGLRTTVG